MVQKKRFGVDTCLIDELRSCQLNRKKNAKMFHRPAIISINNFGETELTVSASHRRLTIASTLINNVRPPVQEIADIDIDTVEIVIDIAMFVRIRFYSVADLNAFKAALGSLNSPEDSSPESSGSPSSSESEISISPTQETMLASKSES
ncbi:hypothetical protein Zmor_020911 [Zophobas morio]|uniref:Uncharacterized protein n=1 Tax=Zophobas morio TaxID=2755281 RepID=A0AA38I8E7_9CUCU|nr:hypothetical protein Zmor_020911 [Zophobas morio]